MEDMKKFCQTENAVASASEDRYKIWAPPTKAAASKIKTASLAVFLEIKDM